MNVKKHTSVLWNLFVRAAALAFAFLGAVGSSATAGEADVIRGTATYRERMAPPPGAVLEVSLQDVARMDVPAKVIGRVAIADPGNPPYSFEIPYDPEAIDERHTYSVRATITCGGELMFTTDTVTPVLTRGAGDEVELLLKRIGRGTKATAFSAAGIAGSFAGILPCAIVAGPTRCGIRECENRWAKEGS